LPEKRNNEDRREEVSSLKEWKCVLVGHHDNVGRAIEEMEKAGWRLHAYTAAGDVGIASSFVNHYLLFVRGE
jgi:hypothetical protein